MRPPPQNSSQIYAYAWRSFTAQIKETNSIWEVTVWNLEKKQKLGAPGIH